MKKKWLFASLLTAMVVLSACNDVDGLLLTDEASIELAKSTKMPQETTNPSTEKPAELTPEQVAVQAKIPFEQLYPDPTIRAYAESMIGIKAPLFTLKNVNGESVSLTDFKGKDIILEIASTGCHVCLDSQPKLNEFQNANPDIPLIQVFLESQKEVETFLTNTNSTHKDTALVDGSLAVMENYEVKFTPILLYINAEGTITFLHVGQIQDQETLQLFTKMAFQ